jgi:hypothetical protein
VVQAVVVLVKKDLGLGKIILPEKYRAAGYCYEDGGLSHPVAPQSPAFGV